MAELYQIYYKEEHRKELYDCAIPIRSTTLNKFFENAIIEAVASECTDDKVSVCSWKLRQKMRWYVGRPRPLTQEVLESDYDVLSFTRNSRQHKMMGSAEVWHKGFKAALTEIVEGIGKNMPNEVKNPIYQNHFSAKTEIYKDYLTEYLSPAMKLIDNDKNVNKLCMVDSNYSALAKKDAASPEYLMEKLGVPYYPLVPFLLERLFSIYVHNKNINVTWL